MTIERSVATELVSSLARAAQRVETPHAAGRMTWRFWGSGPPLLLLHGSHGGWMHWVKNIRGLSASYRVIVPDLPGFGESDPPRDLESPADHAGLIADGLRRLGIDGPINVAGFSLGAMIGCYLSLALPEAVARLILVDAGGLGTPYQSADLRSPKDVPAEDLRALNRHNLAALMFWDSSRIDDQAVDINMLYGPLTRTRVQFHVLPDGLLAVLRRVWAPVDLIWGEFDFPHPDPQTNADVVRRFQPEAALRVVRDAGHWSMYEQPQGFNTALRDLLARRSRAAFSTD